MSGRPRKSGQSRAPELVRTRGRAGWKPWSLGAGGVRVGTWRARYWWVVSQPLVRSARA